MTTPLRWQAICSNKPPLFCSFCRKPESRSSQKLMQCNRCQLKHYCSNACEFQDQVPHHGYCFHIERMRKHSETYPSHPLGVLSHQMGNLIFHVAYRTMDTLEHEAWIFQEALRYFLEAYVKYQESGRPVHNLEDQILVIYSVLGYDSLAFCEIFHSLSNTYSEMVPHESVNLFEVLPDAPWRTSQLNVYLLLKMRLLHRLRSLQNRYLVFQSTYGGSCLEQVSSVVFEFLIGRSDEVHSQERQIQQIFDRIPPAVARTICNSRPMTHLDAPTLFHVLVPTECWQILQGCFKMMPTTEDMLKDLVMANQRTTGNELH
jgi:hypothetical protein